jgi:predicted HicB family RNase H-like nuclease
MRALEMKRRAEETTKLQLRVPLKLKSEVEAAAEELGQSLSTFAARALASHVLRTKAAAQAVEGDA